MGGLAEAQGQGRLRAVLQANPRGVGGVGVGSGFGVGWFRDMAVGQRYLFGNSYHYGFLRFIGGA